MAARKRRASTVRQTISSRADPAFPRVMSCRVCGSACVSPEGVVEYIAGYAWDVFCCDVCGCQFTHHDAAVYDIMHKTGAISYYSEYRSIAAQCRSYFECKDIEGLRKLLGSASKYGHVIERIERLPPDARLLEIGSSRGYLTASSLLAGRNVLGVDVSRDAVDEARDAFGDHFVLAGDPRIAAGAPYDMVYHVGMIGCVEDPITLTNELLGLLRPGGALFFNAPNRDALYLKNQLWLDSAPPPDLVTLFPKGFFIRTFSENADVVEEVETTPPAASLLIALRQALGVIWSKPVAKPIEAAAKQGLTWSQPTPAVRRLIERIVARIGRLTGLERLVRPRSTEFGLFVTLIRK